MHGRGQDGRATSALWARVERPSARSVASIPGFCVQSSKRDLLSLDKPKIIGYNAKWMVCRAGHSVGARQICVPDVAQAPRSALREWTEQSENVYENKGPGQRRPSGQQGKTRACQPKGRRYQKRRNKARISMKTKDRGSADLRVSRARLKLGDLKVGATRRDGTKRECL
jgi:hypothetical protein